VENFFKIRAERQEHIINAAFAVFGRQGYKKASVADIAEAAGIAKGMVTYYFGSKKNLYLYLAEFGHRILVDMVHRHFDRDVDDFFDKIRMGTEIKAAILKEHPALLQFFVSMYYEQDKDVAAEVKGLIDQGVSLGKRILMKDTDISKFREGFEPETIGKFIHWAGNGLVMDLQLEENSERFDEFVQEFYRLLDMMKIIFYKEG
jgi:AcrR family transcriptional regulator